jgi:ribosomal protein L35AE/L33A
MSLRTRHRHIPRSGARGKAARILKGQIKRAHGARGYDVLRSATRR